VQELADFLEVIRSLAQQHGTTIEEVEAVRKNKAVKRGRFQEKFFLIKLED
jgi:predicted house-cleaning noncanonical NTP pyrophosphatase (MazG superfamily)